MEEQNIFRDLPMNKLMTKMCVPIIITMLIQALYNVVDSLFVAQLGLKPLTALGLAYPIQMIMIATSNGIGVGMNSVVSRHMGNDDLKKAGRATGNAITLALIASLIMLLFGVFGTEFFFSISTTDYEIAQYGSTYLSICCMFGFGLFLSIIGQRMLQVAGNPTWSMLVHLMGCAFNVIFDPILIYGLFSFPTLGVTGATIATISGQILTTVVAFMVCAIKKKGIAFTINDLIPSQDMIDLCKVGMPGAIALGIGSVMSFGMNQILKHETTALGVFTAFYKLWCFVIMPINGLVQGMIPVIGYNYGAKNGERVRSAMKKTIIAGVVIMAIVTVLFQLFASQLIGLFDNGSNGAEFVDMGTSALRIISIIFIPFGIGQICSNLFQGMGNGIPSLIHALMHQCILLLPTTWLLLHIGGTSMIWYAFWFAEIVSTLIVLIIYQYNYKKYIHCNN